MSYPVINDGEPEKEVVRLLGIQVAELLEKGCGFREAMATVVRNRYGGRFKVFYRKVAQYLSQKSKEKRGARKGTAVQLVLL